VKHRHGLVTDRHHLPMVPIVPQSAPMVSVADVSVKLYLHVCKYFTITLLEYFKSSLSYVKLLMYII